MAVKAKSAILHVLLDDKYTRHDHRELKNQFRIRKYQRAIEALEA